MKRPDEADPAQDHAAKLSRVRPVTHDDEERASAEDRTYGETIFTRPSMPVPRLLRGRGKRRKR